MSTYLDNLLKSEKKDTLPPTKAGETNLDRILREKGIDPSILFRKIEPPKPTRDEAALKQLKDQGKNPSKVLGTLKKTPPLQIAKDFFTQTGQTISKGITDFASSQPFQALEKTVGQVPQLIQTKLNKSVGTIVDWAGKSMGTNIGFIAGTTKALLEKKDIKKSIEAGLDQASRTGQETAAFGKTIGESGAAALPIAATNPHLFTALFGYELQKKVGEAAAVAGDSLGRGESSDVAYRKGFKALDENGWSYFGASKEQEKLFSDKFPGGGTMLHFLNMYIVEKAITSGINTQLKKQPQMVLDKEFKEVISIDKQQIVDYLNGNDQGANPLTATQKMALNKASNLANRVVEQGGEGPFNFEGITKIYKPTLAKRLSGPISEFFSPEPFMGTNIYTITGQNGPAFRNVNVDIQSGFFQHAVDDMAQQINRILTNDPNHNTVIGSDLRQIDISKIHSISDYVRAIEITLKNHPEAKILDGPYYKPQIQNALQNGVTQLEGELFNPEFSKMFIEQGVFTVRDNSVPGAIPRAESGKPIITPRVMELSDKVNKVLDPLKAKNAPINSPDEIDALIARNLDETLANKRLEDQAGFMRLPGMQTEKSTADFITDKQVADVLAAGKIKQTNFVNSLKMGIAEFQRNLDKFKFEPELKKAKDLQLVDDIRTGLVPIAEKAQNQALMATEGILGDLKGNERVMAVDLLYLKNFRARADAGFTLPQNMTKAQIEASIKELEGQAPVKVLQSAQKMKELYDTVRKDLVDRGALNPDQYIEDYAPHYVIDYLPDWWSQNSAFLPNKLREPFKAYTKGVEGSSKQVLTSEEALMNNLYTVFLDNAIDDFAIGKNGQLPKYDIMPKIDAKTKTELFGERGTPLPGRIYDVAGFKYKGIQYVPGRVVFPTEIRNEMGDIISEDVGALGKYYKTYLVKEEIANRFNKLKSPAGDIPGLYQIIRATNTWKRLTLGAAGLPFETMNLAGDAINLYRQDAVAFTRIPSATSLLYKVSNNKTLSMQEAEWFKFLQEKDVLDAGFMKTLYGGTGSIKSTLTANPITWLDALLKTKEGLSDFREKTLRVAMGIEQYEKVKAGIVLNAKGINIEGLDPQSQAGKIAREFTVDYKASSAAERRFLRGIVAPFEKFFIENTQNWANYVKDAPVEFTAKFITPEIAAFTYNNTGDRKDVEETLPSWVRQQTHIILNSQDIDGDGKADKATVYTLQTPLDLAAAWVAGNKIGDKVTLVRAGKMTAQEAAVQQLKDMGMAPLQEGQQLLNPMIQFFIGIKKNQDPYTKRTIVPEKLKGTSEEKKLWGEYLIEKVSLPVAQYSTSQNKGEYANDPLTRWLQAGPFDFERAFGIYNINLSGDTSIKYNVEAKLRGVRNEMLWEIEKAYVNNPDTLKDKILEFTSLGRDGIRLTGEEVTNRLSSPDVIISKLRSEMTSIDDQKIRNEYEETILILQKVQANEHIKSIPKSIRNQYLIQILQKNINPINN